MNRLKLCLSNRAARKLLLGAGLLAAISQAQAGTNHTAFWWNAHESGWGMQIIQFGDSTIASAWYTYGDDGQVTWYTAISAVQSDGSFKGDLYATTGTPFNQIDNAPAKLSNRIVGTTTISFSDDNDATFSYTLNGISQSKALTRISFNLAPVCSNTSSSRSAATNYSDIWWNPDESGWGLSIAHGSGAIFAAWYTYASTGAPMWVTAQATRSSDRVYTGTLYRPTSGTPATQINGSPAIAATTAVGTVEFDFTSGDEGQMVYTLDGVSQTKPITRFSNVSTFPFCQGASGSDPSLSSWLVNKSGQYARVVEQRGGSAVTTWPSSGLTNNGGGQSTVVYSDVTSVRYSDSYVYLQGADLASYNMGPWYLDGVTSGTTIFGNWPSNQAYTYKLPRTPSVATTKSLTTLGPQGLLVNGVIVYNMLDGFYYDTASASDKAGNITSSTIWVRNAGLNEYLTFDPTGAHQPSNGQYHVHISPQGLRLQLNDNIQYNASSYTYSEDTSNLHHSPLLGFANDGYPIYGPYGYVDCSDPTKGVTRMISGFTLRNGSNGTTNLAATGRTTLPKWAATLKGISQTLSSSQYGPAVSTTRPIGNYLEDYDYLGDLGYTQGKDFNLDSYNGRTCKTPDYPNGTYAYYATIDSSGAAVFPYLLGRAFYGNPTGGSVKSVTETVSDYSIGGANTPITLTYSTKNNVATLKWTSVEGGTYKVEGTSDGTTYSTISSGVASGGVQTTYTTPATYKAYRVTLASLASYDNK